MVAGGSSLTYDDILLWNTMCDQRCFYNHLNPADPDTPAARHPFPLSCSSFSAWGEATPDGKMIFGKNMDNLNLPGTLENRILVIVDSDHGCGHTFITHPGMLAIDEGINRDGVAMMTQYSVSINEMQGCGIGILIRLTLANVHRIDDMINILPVYSRCTGINHHVADTKVNRTIVIEVSATEVAVRYPEQGRDVLYYNCYLGWKDYTGYNMVLDQAPVYSLTDVSMIKKWQTSLADRENPNIPAAGRLKRYEQLLNENYGKITVEKGIEILTDRHDPDSDKERDWSEPSPGRNDGGPIYALYSVETLAEDASYYKSNKSAPITAQASCLWSLVAVLADGNIWLVIKDFPAQRGPFEYFNLLKELSRHGETTLREEIFISYCDEYPDTAMTSRLRMYFATVKGGDV